MATPLTPAGVKTFGKETWTFVPAIADKNAPTVAEVTATEALHLQGFIYADGAEGMTVSTNKPQSPRRLIQTETYESLGTTTYAMGDVTYLVDPQAASGTDGKKAWETLTEGTTGFLVRRFGIDARQFHPERFAADALNMRRQAGDGLSRDLWNRCQPVRQRP